MPTQKLRHLFQRNVLEEFSHCQDYYFVNDPRLQIEANDLKICVQSPASLAFDQHMLRTAETDWLAHVLVCLFQECTSAFYPDCKDFYSEVEIQYKLRGFFRGWLAHIELDLDYDHSGFFDDALLDIGGIPRADLASSLRSFWFTFDFLLDALGEIETEGALAKNAPLRLPISGGTLDSKATALVAKNKFSRPIVLSPRTASDLQRDLAGSGVNSKGDAWGGAPKVRDQDLGFLTFLFGTSRARFIWL